MAAAASGSGDMMVDEQLAGLLESQLAISDNRATDAEHLASLYAQAEGARDGISSVQERVDKDIRDYIAAMAKANEFDPDDPALPASIVLAIAERSWDMWWDECACNAFLDALYAELMLCAVNDAFRRGLAVWSGEDGPTHDDLAMVVQLETRIIAGIHAYMSTPDAVVRPAVAVDQKYSEEIVMRPAESACWHMHTELHGKSVSARIAGLTMRHILTPMRCDIAHVFADVLANMCACMSDWQTPHFTPGLAPDPPPLAFTQLLADLRTIVAGQCYVFGVEDGCNLYMRAWALFLGILLPSVRTTTAWLYNVHADGAKSYANGMPLPWLRVPSAPDSAFIRQTVFSLLAGCEQLRVYLIKVVSRMASRGMHIVADLPPAPSTGRHAAAAQLMRSAVLAVPLVDPSSMASTSKIVVPASHPLVLSIDECMHGLTKLYVYCCQAGMHPSPPTEASHARAAFVRIVTDMGAAAAFYGLCPREKALFVRLEDQDRCDRPAARRGYVSDSEDDNKDTDVPQEGTRISAYVSRTEQLQRRGWLGMSSVERNQTTPRAQAGSAYGLDSRRGGGDYDDKDNNEGAQMDTE